MSPLDLHVLGTPPAFVLSQDQTLSFNPFIRIPSSRLGRSLSELTVVLSCVFSLYRFQGSAPLARSLYILSNHPRFVKPFLPFFRDFLNIPHCSNVYNYSFVFIRPFPALCPHILSYCSIISRMMKIFLGCISFPPCFVL